MRTTNLFVKTAVASFTILLGCFLFTTCNTSSGTSNKPEKGKVLSSLNNNDKICKLIKIDELKKAFSKSKGNKIILNVYPVKLSKTSEANDLDLKFFFQDGLDQNKNIDRTGNIKLFETQSEWYIGFLKNKSIPMEKVPPGYFLELDKAFLTNTIGLSVCVEPGKENMQYYFLSEKSEEDSKTAKDTICRCPPVCCKYNIIKSDTTGRCPPDCPTIPLLYESVVKSIIEKKYKNN